MWRMPRWDQRSLCPVHSQLPAELARSPAWHKGGVCGSVTHSTATACPCFQVLSCAFVILDCPSLVDPGWLGQNKLRLAWSVPWQVCETHSSSTGKMGREDPGDKLFLKPGPCPDPSSAQHCSPDYRLLLHPGISEREGVTCGLQPTIPTLAILAVPLSTPHSSSLLSHILLKRLSQQAPPAQWCWHEATLFPFPWWLAGPLVPLRPRFSFHNACHLS